MSRIAVVGLAVGVVLAAGSAVLWLTGSGIGAAGVPAAAAAPAPVAPPPAAVAPVAVSPADAPSVPVRVRVADAEVDAPVVVTGVDERGDMAVPPDVATVGWYRYGATPGAAAGSAVLAGHVDDRVQGRGAFYDLGDVAAGDPVEVTLTGGRVLAYRVTDVVRVPKAALPVDRIFARDGAPQLVLITCGGTFDRTIRSYEDNVVVTAEPVKGAG
ncbi:MAG TPA: class F sortase [Pseudonocardia sp.]